MPLTPGVKLASGFTPHGGHLATTPAVGQGARWVNVRRGRFTLGGEASKSSIKHHLMDFNGFYLLVMVI